MFFSTFRKRVCFLQKGGGAFLFRVGGARSIHISGVVVVFPKLILSLALSACLSVSPRPSFCVCERGETEARRDLNFCRLREREKEEEEEICDPILQRHPSHTHKRQERERELQKYRKPLEEGGDLLWRSV